MTVEVRKPLSGQVLCAFCFSVLLSLGCGCFWNFIFWVSLEFSFTRGGVQFNSKAQISAILGTMLQKRALVVTQTCGWIKTHQEAKQLPAITKNAL